MASLWRLWVFMLWFGTMFAILTVVIAVTLCAVLCAVAMGLLMPSRTVGGQLRSLLLNTEAGIAQVRALRPS
jgi:hypothetical protein